MRSIVTLLLYLLPLTLYAHPRFGEVYRAAREQVLKECGPIIISRGDSLVVRYQGTREEVRYMPEEYHRLKRICHIPVAIEVCMAHLKADPAAISAIRAEIDAFDTVDPILASSLSYLDSNESLEAFCQGIAPQLLDYAAEAAFLQLDALHTQVQQWKARIPQEDWNRLCVIVVGPQTPRVGEVSMQYFARLTGKKLADSQILPATINGDTPVKASKRERRLVYAESLWNEEDALNLLATHIIDEKMGRLFFNDQQRMFYDLMGEAASKRLEAQCDVCHSGETSSNPGSETVSLY